MDRPDDAADVVCQHLAQRLVHLASVAFGQQGVTELGLDHREGGLDVGALVVVRPEGVALVGEQVVHALPCPVARSKRWEWSEWTSKQTPATGGLGAPSNSWGRISKGSFAAGRHPMHLERTAACGIQPCSP